MTARATMNSSLLLFVCFWLLLGAPRTTTDAASKSQCNVTVESDHAVLSSPALSHKDVGLGRPLSCWYRIRPPREVVLRITFRRFKVGILANSTTCIGGYMQIVDGNNGTKVTNKKSPGMFCGETEQPQTFISETSFVRLHFHVDNFTEQTYWTFETRTEQPYEVYLRYGQHPELYPNQRGTVTKKGAYCERSFVGCKLQACSVQSPAFPGVTPRALHCRYRINTVLPHIKLYLENEEFNVDGQRCENIMTCPMRPISSGAENCPHDFLRVYDGKDDKAPLIGVFCGMGRFPYPIIGTGTDLFVEFITSPAGPLLNSGFRFNVGDWAGSEKIAASRLGTCSWNLTQSALRNARLQEGVFLSVAHWYPPHTACTYLIEADRDHLVRLSFPSFRINRIESPIAPWDGDCGESLTLYDSSWADDTKIIRTFCDTFSRPQEKDFVSSGEHMFIRFESKTGSYSGSSLYYWAQYDFFNNALSGEHVLGTACDELIPSWRASRGSLRSPTNSLIYKGVGPGGVSSVAHGTVTCTYRLVTDPRLYSRVELVVHHVNISEVGAQSTSCWKALSDRLLLWEPQGAQAATVLSGQARDIEPVNSSLHGFCIQNNKDRTENISMISRGPALLLQLSLRWPGAEQYFRRQTPLFKAEYRFVHGPLCGPTSLPAADHGHLSFPHLEALAFSPPPREIDCRWDLNVHGQKDLWLHFEKLSFTTSDCKDARLQISLTDRRGAASWFSSCGNVDVPALPILAPQQLLGPITITLTASHPNAVSFTLRWTELHRGSVATSRLVDGTQRLSDGSAQGVGAGDSRSNDDCGFVCPGSAGRCISSQLLCNGVRNCPPPVVGVPESSVPGSEDMTNVISASSDEDPDFCKPVQEEQYPKWTLLVGGASASILALAALFLMCRACCYCCCVCCRKNPNRDIDVPY